MRIVKNNLALFWDHDEDELAHIKLTKLDITQDLSGSFMPMWNGAAKSYIKERLQAAVTMLFTSEPPNFLSLYRI